MKTQIRSLWAVLLVLAQVGDHIRRQHVGLRRCVAIPLHAITVEAVQPPLRPYPDESRVVLEEVIDFVGRQLAVGRQELKNNALRHGLRLRHRGNEKQQSVQQGTQMSKTGHRWLLLDENLANDGVLAIADAQDVDAAAHG